MKNLPPAPDSSFSYSDITVVFDSITPGDPERGFVPGYHFKIHAPDSIIVGHLNFRVGDTEHVRLAAGHIGFAIDREHRGHSYAAKACLAAAPWIFRIADRVLITCDPDNFASQRTIEKIGAKYLDLVKVPDGDPHYTRGSYRKRRYIWQQTH